MSSVSRERIELTEMRDVYNLIADTIAGEKQVKSKRTKHLPEPKDNSADDTSTQDRYNSYLLRAVYYNVILPTRDALVGQLFLRPPKVELPASMELLIDDMNGEGLGLEQLVRLAANHVLPYGRCGLLSDFPRRDTPTTRGDVTAGIRPSIKFYSPWAIINWRSERINGHFKLSLVVLKEATEVLNEDRFSVTIENRYRVYRLDETGASVEVWGHGEAVEEPKTYIRDGKSQILQEIPFEFVGSANNDPEIDAPPLYPIATLNIAHYRNSADYEESVYLVGQPTPVFTGLTRDWVDNYFSKGIPLGSRAAVPLPEKATAELLQAKPNTMAFEAMGHKEQQMLSIGAKIKNPNQNIERKEAEIQIEAASDQSVLKTVRNNLQKAFTKCLKHCAGFVNEDPTTIECELNDNFDLTSLTGEEIRWLLELFKEKAMSYESLHENLRRSGFFKNSSEEEQALILKNLDFLKKVLPVEEPTKPKTKEEPKPNA